MEIKAEAGTSSARTTALSTLIWSALWQSGWAPPPLSSTVAMYRCSRSLMWSSTSSVPRGERGIETPRRVNQLLLACPALNQ